MHQDDSVEIAIIRITLLSFLLHFLFDLLRSPKGSWVGSEDSPARARPADVVLRQPDCNVPINLELNAAETGGREAPPGRCLSGLQMLDVLVVRLGKGAAEDCGYSCRVVLAAKCLFVPEQFNE